MSTIMTMAQVGVEELPEPEFLRYYLSEEDFKKDFNKWCNITNSTEEEKKRKEKRKRKK